ncbi:hypothetical protein AB0I82_35920 [Streptomyces sp. NPDC050315]|uniref:hypothetical protein n=1 Tax=Streptomyces sp. NPDC050315 TaxID=3155039 RepID=UPI0034195424
MNDRQDAFSRLTTEWAWVCAKQDNTDVIFGWLADAGVLTATDLADLAGLEELLPLMQERDRAQGRAHSDLWLGALLRQAMAEGAAAQLAARVVVQTMLPSARRTATRLLRSYGRRYDEVAQAVIASLCQVVRSYPLARRPQKIAANLAMETLHLASRELQRECEAIGEELHEEVAEQTEAGSAADPVACAEVTLLAEAAAACGLETSGDAGLAGARGEMIELLVWALSEKVLAEDGVRAITDHYRAGALPDREAAQAAGVAPAAWRRRRSRAVERLRDAAPQWLAQAA